MPIFREVAKEHGIPYMEMSYWNSLRSHFRFLRGMGQHPHLEPLKYEG